MKNRLFYFLLFMCITTTGNAQIVTDSLPTKQLNFDLDAFSLDVGCAFKLNGKMMLGLGVGLGLGHTQLFIDDDGDRVLEVLHARMFLGNQQLKKGFSWESGIMWSLIGVGNSDFGAVGIIGNLYFRPYIGGKKWKIGTQLGYGFSDGDSGFMWTPVLLRYTIHYPKKQ